MGLFWKNGKKDETEQEQNAPVNDLEIIDEAFVLQMKAAIHLAKQSGNDSSRVAEIMKLFAGGDFFVPVTVKLSDEDEKQLRNVNKGDIISLQKNMAMMPDYLKIPDGKLFFPAFTSRGETAKDYRTKYSWINMPGKDIAEAALKNKKLYGVVINGFSESFVLPRPLLEMLVNKSTQEHKIKAGTELEMKNLDSKARSLKLAAAEVFKKYSSIKKAFAVRLKQNGEESCLFVIDTDDKDPRQLFGELHQQLSKYSPDMPIDYAKYPAMKQQLMSIGCPVLYKKDGYYKERVSVPIDENRFFFVGMSIDGDGWVLDYSFDFEKVEDSHYVFSGDEGARLIRSMGGKMGDDPGSLVDLVRKYFSPVLSEPEKLEPRAVKLLNEAGVKYSQIHF